ncbi:MAG: ATP-binding protein [Longimicrobiales bacterium]|nr:ATP-binding protein [Longimicrobiales bacterium]
MVSIPVKAVSPASGQLFSRNDLLRWVYLGRLTLVTGILAGALYAWPIARPQDTRLVLVMFLVAYAVTAGSFWYSHVLSRGPREDFLYAQVILDVLLVTGIVHVTGGPDSSFAPLFILVVSAGALLLPLPGGVLIGGLASMVYFGDLVWGYQGVLRLQVGLQIGLFTLVALLTGLVGDRLRRAGQALGAVESELRQLRLDTGDILATLATGVLTVDSRGRLAYANPAAEELLRLRAADWMGREVVDEVERRAPGMGKLLLGALRERTRVDRYRTTLTLDGRAVRLGISTAVLDRADHAAPSATAIFQDITDLELLEALNRRAERLEAVAALSASLAHEIKNPLASIRSAVEQLTRPSLDTADRNTLQRLVLVESDRLSRLLSEFLDYSGLRLGARERVDLGGVVRDGVALLRQHPEAKDVTVTCRGQDSALNVIGDPDLLHRALFNLLLNAVQFAEPGGRVRVSLEDSRARPYPRGTSIRSPVAITVADSGPGVDPEVQNRIFDPFFTTREGGSGLGLAVVYRAVEAHEGSIFVDRSEEGGAEFVIYLPAAPEAAGKEVS